MKNEDNLIHSISGLLRLFAILLLWKVQWGSAGTNIGNRFKRIWHITSSYFRKIHRISLSRAKQESLFWKDLIRLHKKYNWQHGVYESEKCITTVFEIAPNTHATYFYMIYESHFLCRVKILDDFPAEITTQLFVLAAHFNNLLKDGVVAINVNERFVEFRTKRELLSNLIYPGETLAVITRHGITSKDIYWAFEKLLKDGEEPAFIIADLMRQLSDNEK